MPTYQIYEGKFTVIIALLVKEKEVEVDNVVFLCHNTTEEFTEILMALLGKNSF